MNVYDPIYGRFALSSISSELCILPEVRRLSQIRLLNSISPSLATLSELRRYAHTLGVLHLFQVWKAHAGCAYSVEELDALEVAIILHDVATPPFGHLFEYILKEATGWDHEAAAVTTLLKSYSPASTAQTIYVGKTPKVLDLIERRGVNIDLVKAILTKKHRLSGLIMGVLDFDNLDNVWRMAWSLGMECKGEVVEKLAAQLNIDDAGKLILQNEGIEYLKEWARLRRAVYGVLVFDQPTVASQTVLTHCIRVGLSRGVVTGDDWFLNDESLLMRLSTDSELKVLIDQQYLGRLPTPVVTVQLRWSDLKIFKLERAELEELIRKSLAGITNDRWWIYVFKEKGSFEKQVNFSTPNGESHVYGSLSRSAVISVFSSRPLTQTKKRNAAGAVIRLLQEHGVNVNELMRTIEGEDEPIDHEEQLSF